MPIGRRPEIPFSMERFSPDPLTTSNPLNRSKLLILKRILLGSSPRVCKILWGCGVIMDRKFSSAHGSAYPYIARWKQAPPQDTPRLGSGRGLLRSECYLTILTSLAGRQPTVRLRSPRDRVHEGGREELRQNCVDRLCGFGVSRR